MISVRLYELFIPLFQVFRNLQANTPGGFAFLQPLAEARKFQNLLSLKPVSYKISSDPVITRKLHFYEMFRNIPNYLKLSGDFRLL
jgi:hypothetical protein